MSMDNSQLIDHLQQAVEARLPLFDANHHAALRLFNGFSEGESSLAIDLYGSTLVLHNYSDEPEEGRQRVQEAQNFLRSRLSWLRAGIEKTRNSQSQADRRGKIVFGELPDRKIKESGVWYAIDLMMHRDTGFYLDTRNLRKWLIDHMNGKTVLNTFAYTGSLGVAAFAGKAKRVIQLDLNRQFLNLAKASYTLNGFPIQKRDFLVVDFFPAISRLKRAGETFDCAIIDPPFFSTTTRGRVDQQNDNARLINKVRPLINHGGTLVAINNALYLSGIEYLQTLEALCRDGYLQIQEFVPVPDDIVGYNPTGMPVTDPAPFNHSTKIAILSVRRKKT